MEQWVQSQMHLGYAESWQRKTKVKAQIINKDWVVLTSSKFLRPFGSSTSEAAEPSGKRQSRAEAKIINKINLQSTQSALRYYVSQKAQKYADY